MVYSPGSILGLSALSCGHVFLHPCSAPSLSFTSRPCCCVFLSTVEPQVHWACGGERSASPHISRFKDCHCQSGRSEGHAWSKVSGEDLSPALRGRLWNSVLYLSDRPRSFICIFVELPERSLSLCPLPCMPLPPAIGSFSSWVAMHVRQIKLCPPCVQRDELDCTA